MQADIRIAAVIFEAPFGQVRENLQRMEAWVAQAKKRQVDAICFPELNITGYHPQSQIAGLAEEIPGPISRHLVRAAKAGRCMILAGMLETDAQGGIYASHLAVSGEGLLGVYRKTHIAPPELNQFAAGDTVPLFEFRGVKFGIQLCYDAHFPELSTRMALEGADLIFMPHASPRGTPEEKIASWSRHLTARAFDNGLFVVACNQCGDNRKNLRFPGIAMVIGPDGGIMARRSSSREAMLVFDLKAQLLESVRGHPMRYFLPSRRSDLY
jgi:N-carbamoylputrescine amidase